MIRFKKTLSLIARLIVTLCVIFIIYFVWFTPLGYRMSISLHGFSKVSEHIYIDKEWDGDKEQLLTIVNEAKQRVNSFFGEVKSSPILIICDNNKKIERLGGDHNTLTVRMNGVNSYISLSSEFLNVDILAHEMTHAETHKRIYNGGISSSIQIPIWFDEGLAIQNDYREPYSYKTWLQITENGKKVPPVSEYDTSEKFFSGTIDDRRIKYCLAGHEVSEWLSTNGKEKLIQMLNEISQDKKFIELYF